MTKKQRQYIYGQIAAMNITAVNDADHESPEESAAVCAHLYRIQKFFKKQHIKDPVRRAALRSVLLPQLLSKYYKSEDVARMRVLLIQVNTMELLGFKVMFKRKHAAHWKAKEGDQERPATPAEIKKSAIISPFFIKGSTIVEGQILPTMPKIRTSRVHSSKMTKLFRDAVRKFFYENKLHEKGVGYVTDAGNNKLNYHTGDKTLQRSNDWVRELWREP